MKKGLLILLSVIIMTLCGCSSKDNDVQVGDKLMQEESGTSDVDSIREETETTDYEASEEASDSETTEDEQVVNTTTEPVSETAVETTTAKETESVTQKPVETLVSTTTQVPTTTQKPTTTQAQTTTQTTTTQVVEETTTERATYDISSTEYAEEVKKYTLQYINELRVSEGNVELTNASFIALYSQGRSTQLVTNFAHDTLDERAMATQLQYGRYINPVEYGMEGEPYYEPYGQEAIGKLSITKYVSPEAMARKIANGMYKSKGHWNYVGGTLEFYKDFIYSGIGVTCDGDYLYVCITVDTIKWE